MGFERNKFIDLEDKTAKELICSICFNIFDSAITSVAKNCDHSFCKQCVQQLVESNQKSCPECRTDFTRKRSNDFSNDNNVVIVYNYVFRNNRIVNNIIGNKSVKCINECKGCKETPDLFSLESHSKVCLYRKCKTCEMDFNGSVDDHNCTELLKNALNEWKTKFIKINDKNSKLKENLNEMKTKFNELETNYKKLMEENNIFIDKNTDLEENVSEMKELMENRIDFEKYRHLFKDISFVCPFSKVRFGTHIDTWQELVINLEPSINRYQISFRRDYDYMFCVIKELYFSDTNFPMIVIETDSDSCRQIQNQLSIGMDKFDIESNVYPKSYIIIETMPQNMEFLISMAKNLMPNTMFQEI